MAKLPIIAGRIIIAVLERLGFRVVRQRGSHVVLRRVGRSTDICVVPMHREVAAGTLRSVLRQANLTPDEFLAALTHKAGKI
jgi:predicted RNA binding protein YcfA (HicA-like mRNA interferase family)